MIDRRTLLKAGVAAAPLAGLNFAGAQTPAIREQKVRMKLPEGRKVARVELLRAEADAPFKTVAGAIEFTIPKVLDYETAAVHSA